MGSKDSPDNPDLAWYSAVSRKQGLPPRCPIAHAELCPRYYESAWLLGKEGLITKIPPERDSSLERKWKVFGSVIAEEAASVWGTEKHWNLSHFCPEVSFEIYGYFASDLNEYPDELDREIAYKLHKQGEIEHFDVRWQGINPRHYTECREYSIFATFTGSKPSKPSARPGDVSPKRRWQVFARDSFTCVYCGRKPPEVLHVDHRISVKDGGTDDLDNLVTACDECNGGKGASSLPNEDKPPIGPHQP